jgi:hypothetical protein
MSAFGNWPQASHQAEATRMEGLSATSEVIMQPASRQSRPSRVYCPSAGAASKDVVYILTHLNEQLNPGSVKL